MPKAIFLLLAVGALLIAPPASADSLNIGSISALPVTEIHDFQPFADYLAGELSEDGIDAAKVVIAPGIREMAEMLKNGDVDLFIDSSITALAVNRLAGSQYLLRRWKKGRGQYRSVIFKRQDSAIADLAQLKGKVIASVNLISIISLRLSGIPTVTRPAPLRRAPIAAKYAAPVIPTEPARIKT